MSEVSVDGATLLEVSWLMLWIKVVRMCPLEDESDNIFNEEIIYLEKVLT